jgi:GT2 family glycosyltransferase/glycosyltransferase involved in cell wall biosynthesis
MSMKRNELPNLYYSIPEGVSSLPGERPLLSTPQNGRVALDRRLMDLWAAANGCSLEEMVQSYSSQGASVGMVMAGLACLAEAGLLSRSRSASRPKSRPVKGKLVSVVIVAYNGEEWLKDCLPSLQKQTYSPLEIIVVDNASSQNMSPWLKGYSPAVKVIRLEKPHSIPAANNRGVSVAKGSYFLLLNQDTELEPDAIAEMVRVIESDKKCVSVAPKLKLYWARAFLNGIGNRVQENSWGTDNAIGHLDLGQFDGWREVPSACTAAALFSRQGWHRVGAMDEGFTMYYDDPEWAYRARLMGFKILAAPSAVVYHAFGGRIPSGSPGTLPPQKLKNAVYGRLRFVEKLLEGKRRELLRNHRKEDVRNLFAALAGFHWATARAYLAGWLLFINSRPSLNRNRPALLKKRIMTDEELFALQKGYPEHATWNNLPDLTWERIESQYYPLIHTGRTRALPEFAAGGDKPSLVIISHDVVNEKMGGPGARYLKIAEALAEDIEVTLAVPNRTDLSLPGIRLVSYEEDQVGMVKALVENHDVSLITGYMAIKYPFLGTTQKRLIVDLYDPFFLENMYYYLDRDQCAQMELNESAIDALNALLETGDFFVCGTERQRDFWLGMLSAMKRVNPLTFSQDPTLRKLIDVVGVGFPEQDPLRHTVLRGKSLPKNARMVVWGGGIWNWLDPLTLVSAWPEVLRKVRNAHLVFLGTRYPNPNVPEHRIARETVAAAKAIGEEGKSIHFIEWLPYPDHQALLSESNVGVTLQPNHVEAHFSIRTRVIDYFWSGLPTLVSQGDITADWVKEFKVGEVVDVADVHGVASALIRMLGRPRSAYSGGFRKMRKQFLWGALVDPIKRYCLAGEPAADLAMSRRAPVVVAKTRMGLAPDSPVGKAFSIARSEGLGAMLRRVLRHLKWIILHK